MVIGVLVFYFLGQPSAIDATLDHKDSVSLDIEETVGNELNQVPLEYIGIKYLLIQLIGQICILVSAFMLFKQIRKKQIRDSRFVDLSKEYTNSNLDRDSIDSTINHQSVGSKKRKTLLSCVKYFLLAIFIAPIVIPIMYSMGWLFHEAFSTVRYFIDLSF